MKTVSTANYGRDQSGKFTSGNPGRPPLSANKLQQDIRQQLGEFLEGKLHDVESLYLKLPDRDKAKFLLEVVSYFMPKQRDIFIEKSNPLENGFADMDTWAESDLRLLISLHEKYEIK